MRNGRIVQAESTFGARRMLMTVLERARVCDGRSYPVHNTVQTCDVPTGRLVCSDAVTDHPVSVGGVILPSARQVVTSTDSGTEIMAFLLRAHELTGGPVPTVTCGARRLAPWPGPLPAGSAGRQPSPN